MMVRTWSQIRYWLALSALFCLAMLIMPSGLAMRGPRGTVGWTTAVVLLITPAAIWWSKGTNIGSICQIIMYYLSTLLPLP